MKIKYRFYIALIITLLIIGFVRDYLFVNLNYQASLAYYKQKPDYEISGFLAFIQNWSYTKLYYSKWILTFLFAFLYGLVAFLSVRFVFKSKLYNRVTLFIYIAIFVISLMAFGIGYVTNNYSKGYSIARQLMGWLQSPVVLMILMPALFLNNNEKGKNTTI